MRIGLPDEERQGRPPLQIASDEAARGDADVEGDLRRILDDGWPDRNPTRRTPWRTTLVPPHLGYVLDSMWANQCELLKCSESSLRLLLSAGKPSFGRRP